MEEIPNRKEFEEYMKKKEDKGEKLDPDFEVEMREEMAREEFKAIEEESREAGATAESLSREIGDLMMALDSINSFLKNTELKKLKIITEDTTLWDLLDMRSSSIVDIVRDALHMLVIYGLVDENVLLLDIPRKIQERIDKDSRILKKLKK